MKIFTRELGIASTNTFLFINEAAGKAVVFDAPEGSFDWVSEVLEREELTLEALYLTHGHYDHILDAWKFREAGISVCAHRDDRVLIEQAEVQSTFLWEGLELKPVQVDCWLEAGEHLVIRRNPVRYATCRVIVREMCYFIFPTSNLPLWAMPYLLEVWDGSTCREVIGTHWQIP